MPIKVLVVDDSALVRKIMTQVLDEDPEIEVVGTAMDPYIAREKIKRYKPDVLTLDIEMPKMDGITFLGKLMHLRPMPVIMVSSLTERGAEVTLKALEMGAFDFVTKPKGGSATGLKECSEEIREKVKAASRAKVNALAKVQPSGTAQVQPAAAKVEPKYSADIILPRNNQTGRLVGAQTLFAIGASTGGTEAIKQVLSAMPANSPAIVITQHIPAAFSAPFAARVNAASEMNVCEAEDGQEILPGHAYIAPGEKHLLVERVGRRYVCRLNDGSRVNRHKPSVDVLFRSVAQTAGRNSIGVLLTGMGDDGARGLKEMQEAGAPTIAQDESTSVVWGMPGAAVKLGAADCTLPLGKVAQALLSR